MYYYITIEYIDLLLLFVGGEIDDGLFNNQTLWRRFRVGSKATTPSSRSGLTRSIWCSFKKKKIKKCRTNNGGMNEEKQLLMSIRSIASDVYKKKIKQRFFSWSVTECYYILLKHKKITSTTTLILLFTRNKKKNNNNNIRKHIF